MSFQGKEMMIHISVCNMNRHMSTRGGGIVAN